MVNKEKFKKWLIGVIKETIEEETLKEMTTTGNVAGYSTPFAFTRNKKGNETAAKKSGYSVVDRDYENADPLEEKEILNEGTVGDPFLARKTSNLLAEINRMMTLVEVLLDRRLNPKNASVVKENSFAKRTPKDITDIKERCGNIISKFSKLNNSGQSVTELVKEASTPSLEPRTFDVSSGYENFQNDLSRLITGYESLYNQSLKNKEVTIRASKGFGQIKKDYKVIVSSVTLSIMKDEYQLIIKDNKQKEYYLDNTFKIVISGQNSEQPPQQQNQNPQSVEKAQPPQQTVQNQPS